MIHPRMATMLLRPAHRPRRRDPANAPRPPPRCRGRAPGTSSPWDGDTSTTTRCSWLASGRAASRPGGHGPLDDTPLGRRSRPSPGTSPVSRRPTARVPRRRHVPGLRRRRRRGRPGCGPAVISSSLVKAAVHGRDPNWGRVAGAAGNAMLAERAVLRGGRGGPPTEGRPSGGTPGRRPTRPGSGIAIAGHLVLRRAQGGPVPIDKAAAREAMGGDEVLIRLDLGLGDGAGEAFGCDLTEEYVRRTRSTRRERGDRRQAGRDPRSPSSAGPGEVRRRRPQAAGRAGARRRQALTEWLERLGVPTRFEGGLRVTDPAALEVAARSCGASSQRAGRRAPRRGLRRGRAVRRGRRAA